MKQPTYFYCFRTSPVTTSPTWNSWLNYTVSGQSCYYEPCVKQLTLFLLFQDQSCYYEPYVKQLTCQCDLAISQAFLLLRLEYNVREIGQEVRMERLDRMWEWKDWTRGENGKIGQNVRMERLDRMSECENGKIGQNVRMERLDRMWEWKDWTECENRGIGQNVRMERLDKRWECKRVELSFRWSLLK